MSGEMEAAGALATAGAVAGVVEGREPGQAGEGVCLNCGAKIEGRFCSNCGQATHAHRSLMHMAGEFLHSLFGFDTKIWRTLPQVIFRPGTLTRDYVYGKRARYISPLALFLLAIFAMFFVFSFVKAPVEMGGTPQAQRAAAVENLAEARRDLDQARAELAQEQRELAARPADDEDAPGAPRDLGVRLATQAVQLAEAGVARREAQVRRIDERIAQGNTHAAQAGATGEQPPQGAAATQPAPATGAATAPAAGGPAAPATDADEEKIVGVGWEDGETWQDGFRRAAEREDLGVNLGSPELNERVRQNFRNPDLMVYKMQEAASKFSFLLAPLSLPFIALLFLWKRGVNLYDHVVYALYALSFAAILFGVVMLATMTPWTGWVVPWLVLVGLPVHTWFHLKGAYALGWWSATWRTFFMLTFACIILVIFLSAVLVLGLVA